MREPLLAVCDTDATSGQGGMPRIPGRRFSAALERLLELVAVAAGGNARETAERQREAGGG